MYTRSRDGNPEDSQHFSLTCSNDTYFYQTCGDFNFETRQINRTLKYLCSFYVCEFEWTRHNSAAGKYIDQTYTCDTRNSIQCKSGIDEENCIKNLDDLFVCGSATIPKILVCNGKCDCLRNCRDELECFGYSYTQYCEEGGYTIPAFETCGMYSRCWSLCNGKDSCLGRNTRLMVIGLNNYTRCFPWIHCENNYDQTNCSNPSLTPLNCTVNGYDTSISGNIICNNDMRMEGNKIVGKIDAMCEDKIDAVCVRLNPECFLHKHMICDGIQDCRGGYDESSGLCYDLIDAKCVRRVSYVKSSVPIPLSWLGDGVIDCVNGEDEDMDRWPRCLYDTFSNVVKSNESCKDLFICSTNKFITTEHLCGKSVRCLSEKLVCAAVNGFDDLKTSVPTIVNTLHLVLLSFCQPGLSSLHDEHGLKCALEYYPNINILGTRTNNIVIPQHPVDCSYFYGENYVFMSCSSRCQKAACPIKSPLTYKSCPAVQTNRIYSLVNGDYLTLVSAYHNEFRVLNMFECRNYRCIPFAKVCNLVDDCGDGSDEDSCENNFICNRNHPNFSRSYIPKSKFCDGTFDCTDLSDECNTDCSKDVIKGYLLKASSWLIGSSALILNTVVIFKNLKLLPGTDSSITFKNRSLVILISIGDWAVGGYLVGISVVDVYYSDKYCTHQREWLVSNLCSVFGVVSTVGSQMSLFSMTLLSFSRLRSIKKQLITSNNITRKFYVMVVLQIMVIISASLAIAIIPLLIEFEDLFVNSLYYRNNPLFKGLMTKKQLFDITSNYYGTMRDSKKLLPWKQFRFLITSMFTKNYGTVRDSVHNFYGNDAVCLFKYFVTNSDSQRQYSWTVLTTNFLCFTVITVSYVWVNLISRRSASALGQGSSNTYTSRRNKKLSRKISMIIATDFCCWIPFIIMCCLHTANAIDASTWYSIFSIVILPINSVINPILYDENIAAACMKVCQKINPIRKRSSPCSSQAPRTENIEIKNIESS